MAAKRHDLAGEAVMPLAGKEYDRTMAAGGGNKIFIACKNQQWGARQDLGYFSSVGENGRRKISHQQFGEWINSDRGRHIYIGQRINMNGETKISKSATPDQAVQYLPSILDPF